MTISPFLDDPPDPPLRGVRADVGIGISVQDVDRGGVVRVPTRPCRRAVKPIPDAPAEQAVAGMTCDV